MLALRHANVSLVLALAFYPMHSLVDVAAFDRLLL